MTDPRGRHTGIKPKEPTDKDSKYHGGSFGAYMAYKNEKLREQFQQEQAQARAAGEPQQAPGLFTGVCIHVNGLTNPTHQELKAIMAAHGGIFDVYYSKQRVTHIICSNLPSAKIKALEKERSSTPIVRPEWIVDSLKAGCILPHENYALWRLRDVPGQATLTAFQAQPITRSAALPGRPQDPGAGPALHQPAAVLRQAPGKQGRHASPAAERTTEAGHTSATVLPQAPGKQGWHAIPAGERATEAGYTSADRQPGRPGMPEQFSLAAGGGEAPAAPSLLEGNKYTVEGKTPPGLLGQASAVGQPQMELAAPVQMYEARLPALSANSLGSDWNVSPDAHCPGQPGMSIAERERVQHTGGPASDADAQQTRDAQSMLSREHQKAQAIAAAARATCDMLKGAPKSSREDPQFMENYYKSSRLHFIGTWKARIEALAAKSAGSMPVPSAPGARSGQRSILHLDMDCFFASVAALEDPCLQGKPLAVCHSNSAQGTAEISSCNYEARAYGIRAVMCVGEAKRLCPSLIVMPYQYDKYEAVSEQVYKILMQHTAMVQPISCDEAFLDVTGLGDAEAVAASIRAQIFQQTKCTASAGISHNMLLARLATKAGKPNGQFRITPDQVDKHLLELDVSSLPGVGWSTRQRLEALNIHTVAQLRLSSKDTLKRELGEKTGTMLWAAAFGQDSRPVEPCKVRRSVGAEVNYGIRFTCEADAEKFVDDLAGEVQSRMREAGVKGRSISLKIKRRKSNAPEPIKFLGHGPCDNLSRSVTLSRFTDSAADLAREAHALLHALRVPATQIRGIGISVSKLDNDTSTANAAPGQGRLPRAAPAASTYRPGLRPNIGTSEITSEDLVAAGGGLHTFNALRPFANTPQPQRWGASPDAGSSPQTDQSTGKAPRSSEATPEKGSIQDLFQRRQSPSHGALEASRRSAAALDEEPLGNAGSSTPVIMRSLADSRPAQQRASVAQPLSAVSVAVARVDPVSMGEMSTALPGFAARESEPWDGSRPEASSLGEPSGGAAEPLRNPPASPDCVYSGMRLELNLDSGDEVGHDGGLSPVPGDSDEEGWHEPDADGGVGRREPAARAEPAAEQTGVRGVDADHLRLSQVDAAVFAELPADVQNQLLQHMSSARKGPPLRSFPGSGQPGTAAQAATSTSGSTPIQALPPVAQIDASVLDALPLQLKRELERAYGIGGMKSPPDKSKRKRGGGNGRLAGGCPFKRRFPEIAAPLTRLEAGLTPGRVDLGVLRELPLDMQREVAAELAHSRAVAALRPVRQPAMPPPEPSRSPSPSPAGPPEPQEPLPDDPRSTWPVVENALEAIMGDLEAISQQRNGSNGVGWGRMDTLPEGWSSDSDSERVIGSTDPRLDALATVVCDWGDILAEDNLEGLQHLMRQLKRLAARWPRLAVQVQGWLSSLQVTVAQRWGGRKLSILTSLD